MRIEQLTYLVTIAEVGSFTEASKRLFVNQSSISRSIQQLESELGMELLNRTASGASLTSAGYEILEHARGALSELDNIRNIANIETGKQLTQVKIVAGAIPISTILSNAVAASGLTFSENTVSIREGSTQFAELLLSRNEIDFAVVPYIDLPENLKGFDFVPVLSTDLMAIVGKNFVLSERESLTFQDIQPYPVSLGNDDSVSGSYILQNLRKYGEPRIALRTQDVITAAQYASASQLVALSFNLAVLSNQIHPDRDVRWLPVVPTVKLQFGILTKKGRRLSPLARALIRQVRQEAAGYQAIIDAVVSEAHWQRGCIRKGDVLV